MHGGWWVTVSDQSEADNEIGVPCRFPCPNAGYSKVDPNECGLSNIVAELVTLSARGSSEKCHIAGGINHSGEKLQAGRSSGQPAKSLPLAVIVPSPTRMSTNCPDVIVLPEA